ncbi:MAG: ComEC/Rec2 family competence protein, partial [Novosphingobium sp.]
MSSGLDSAERFLERAGFDRAPWLAVGFAGGIAAWFALPERWQWQFLIAGLATIALAAQTILRLDGRFSCVRQALTVMALAVSLGAALVWTKSELVGVRPIARPMVVKLTGTVLAREDRESEQKLRLILAIREPDTGRPIKVRINVRAAHAPPSLRSGAMIRMRARLMPPLPPAVPGAYDFSRMAWFQGLAATGSGIGPIDVVKPSQGGGTIEDLQARLATHVRARVDGPAGAIAVTLASGHRGAISAQDDQAMRDSGLAHLLSISGLHVSALVGAAYILTVRLLALWPALALRVRLPLIGAMTGAAAGLGYTILTGAEVPTVRSCIAALLVLMALAVGRQPLSMRMLAVAAFVVMLFWPEAAVGPSFQMSFAAVIAIVALHGCEPVRRFMAPREEAIYMRWARGMALLLLTGLVIELALLPIGMLHFHRAGVYGALAN